MCLIVFAYDVADHALIFAANRDELYDRPTAAAHAWSDAPDVFGGRDLEKGGTWMVFARTGRLAAGTNVGDWPPADRPRSRGVLCADFARGARDARWPKVVRAMDAMRPALDGPRDAMTETLFAMLADRTKANERELPSTGVPVEIERDLSPIFIASPRYGTRSSTVVVWRRDG